MATPTEMTDEQYQIYEAARRDALAAITAFASVQETPQDGMIALAGAIRAVPQAIAGVLMLANENSTTDALADAFAEMMREAAEQVRGDFASASVLMRRMRHGEKMGKAAKSRRNPPPVTH